MERWVSVLKEVYMANSRVDLLIVIALSILLLGLFWALKMLTARRLEVFAKTTKTELDDLAVEMIRRTNSLLLFAVAFYLSSHLLVLSDFFKSLMFRFTLLILFFQMAVWGNMAITYWIKRTINRKRDTDPASVSALDTLAFFARTLLWFGIIMLALNNFGVDITALIAGLGVGGIAVALAAQNILSDIFCSVAIILDKPFEVGDFIIVGDYLGVVERIGIKTTRVRSLGGEQLIFSNADLISSRVKNYKRMYERRVLFHFGVIYQTSLERLEKIPSMVKGIIDGIENTRFDRAHFQKYGDSSLDFEVVYYVKTGDYNLYMDIQQKINLSLFGLFEREGIDFAYPTRTLYIQKETNEKIVPQQTG